MTERARIALLQALLETNGSNAVTVGIGDDAAVLEGGLVWTVDAQVDGTHFTTALASWEDIGWRSFMAAASDLAAMGAEPIAALSSLVLAPDVDDAALASFGRGQAAASRVVGAPVAGGNLARGRETSITTTVLGRATSPVLRSGARAGDGLWLAGPCGLAGAGFALLDDGTNVDDARIAGCLDAWRRPIARIAAGRTLAGHARAAIDISDGLAHDAAQLAEASNVSVVLDAVALLGLGGEGLAVAAQLLGRDPLSFVLDGGEDYALLAASAEPLEGFLRVGHVIEKTAPRIAIGTTPYQPKGFDHFG